MKRLAAAALPLVLAGCSARVQPGALEGWNVLLITVDTLRADRVGFAGYGPAATPAMDGLAGRGTVFEGAVSSAPVTLVSHATILTGLYPPAHGALDNGLYRLSDEVPTLAERLRARGYETAGFVAALVLSARYGTARGFDHFDDDLRLRRHGHATAERPAGRMTDLVLEWMAQHDGARPFFVWAHYYDPHSPYEPPDDLRPRFAANPYDGEIAYADREIGRLLEALRKDGTLDRTLVVLVGDHGEALGDGGEAEHGLLLRGTTLRVPLVISAPGVLPQGRRVAGTVTTADILPTVLELVGAEPPPVDGVSLVAAFAGRPPAERTAYSETRLGQDEYGWAPLQGVRTDRWAWVRAPRPELYDLAADPAETRNVADEHPDVAAELDGQVESVQSRVIAAARSAPDEEEQAALRALGYVVTATEPERTGANPMDMMPFLQRVDQLGALVDRGRFDEAVAEGRRLLAEQPDNRTVLLYLAQALSYVGELNEAIGMVRTAYERSGSADEDGTLLALLLVQAGRIDESERLLRTFTEMQPGWPQHWYNLGNLLMQRGRMEEAVAAYERALDLEQDSVPTLTNLSEALSRLEPPPDADRAVRLIDRAIEGMPGDDRLVLTKVRVLRNLGRVEDARNLAEELSSREPVNVAPAAVEELVRSLESGSREGP